MEQKITMAFKGNCPTIRIYGCGLNVVVFFSLNIIERGKGEPTHTQSS